MQRRQIILVAALFTAVVGLLAILYAVFLRPNYSVLYEGLREADAAQIVTELEKQGIPYRLADSGRRILVPEGDADKARVVIAGSGITTGGVVGFELFNEADMGLTEFAEKVNYQRALQGELARTIMMMDGVAFARVHLSLPERTLFRAAKANPRAAATIQTVPGRSLDARQVEGIQRLIASSVSDMPAQEVAVLDAKGDLISLAPPIASAGGPLDERRALEAYFQARAQTAAARLLPGLPFEVRVMAQGDASYTPPPAAQAAPPVPATPPAPGLAAKAQQGTGGTGLAPPASPGSAPASGTASKVAAPAPTRSADPAQGRNFSLRVALRTEADLNEENRSLLRQALSDALGLAPERGDVLRFETGPLGLAGQAGWDANAGMISPPPATTDERAIPPYKAPSAPLLDRTWAIGIALALGLVALAAILIRRRRARMDASEQDMFADLLSGHLATQEGGRHG